MKTDQPDANRNSDLVCFSHLRWGFVFQRPQHLMSRFAADRRVFFIEEAVYEELAKPVMRTRVCEKTGVSIVTPATVCRDHARGFDKDCFADGTRVSPQKTRSTTTLPGFTLQWLWITARSSTRRSRFMTAWTSCRLFHNAPPGLRENEKKLFAMANLVFTGGISLYEAKAKQHQRVYPFPSSVDGPHFAQARRMKDTSPDQRDLPRPRIGYAGCDR